MLEGLDAEDDVEWAAAGGREGLGEVDAAIGKFEGLIGVYVTAIENLQERKDVSKVSSTQLKAQVDRMELILTTWEHVRRSLKTIKGQVELAMEWEEMWNVVLGDIGLEMENLASLIFEMEESRYRSNSADPLEGNGGLDMQELDTIVEETTMGEKKANAHRISIPSGFQVNSPITSPTLGLQQDDTRLLALFARMQPLRASLDFLPMTLSSFRARAEMFIPSACQELDSRRVSLEKKWKALERDAEGLRQELGEDRWVLVFRNAGRQAQKLCESVARSITKLQESIDLGTQHSNPPLLAKKVEAYEAKKKHYVPAIKKVLAIIEKGVMDRLTVNGEIIRLQMDAKSGWQSLETDMKDIDLALDDLAMSKNQQLRDSISSIVSTDRSAFGSAIDTPGSSPASSVAMGPTNRSKRDPSPGMNGLSGRSTSITNGTGRPNGSRRYVSMPPGSLGSSTVSKAVPARSFTSDARSRGASPSRYANESPQQTLGSRSTTPWSHRPALQTDNKPRWNSSSKVDYIDFGHKTKPSPFFTPPMQRKSSLSFHSQSSTTRGGSSGHSLASSLASPSSMPSPASSTNMPHRPRLSTGAKSSLGLRREPAAAESSDWVKQKNKTPPASSQSQRTSIGLDSFRNKTTAEESPSIRPRQQRPNTAMACSRRISMLPVLKNAASSPLANVNGRESTTGTKLVSKAREGSLGQRVQPNGNESPATRNSDRRENVDLEG